MSVQARKRREKLCRLLLRDTGAFRATIENRDQQHPPAALSAAIFTGAPEFTPFHSDFSVTILQALPRRFMKTAVIFI